MTQVAPERSALTDKLGVDIDPELLSLALTHRSWAYEHGQGPHNERLEFLGDSVLGQAVTVRLFTANPSLDEGALAKRRASGVSTVALAQVARGIGLGAVQALLERHAHRMAQAVDRRIGKRNDGNGTVQADIGRDGCNPGRHFLTRAWRDCPKQARCVGGVVMPTLLTRYSTPGNPPP